MHPWRLVALVGTGFTALSLALPFVTFPALGAIAGIEAAAWPTLLPLFGVSLVAVTGDRSRGLRPLPGVLTVVAAIGAVLFAVIKVSDALVASRDTAGAALGAGSFVLAGGTLVALAGAALSLGRG